MVNRIVYYNKIEYLLSSAINCRSRDIIGKISGLSSIGTLLSISGPICRYDDNFAHNFSYTPIPKNHNTNMSFEEVCIDAAKNIWDLAAGKKIGLFWSGGIDSTTALVSLMLTNPNWHKDMVIYTSKYSIDVEYPLFYESFLKDVADILMLSNSKFFNPELFNENIIAVDGTCGDQLWGCNIIRKIIDKADLPYQTLFTTKCFTDIFKNIKSMAIKSSSLRYIESLIDVFPVETKTVSDLLWMLTFTHKWDVVRLRHTSNIKDVSKFGKMYSFFNTDNFQRWTMSNSDKRIVKEWNTYKQPAKDFIYSFTKDNDYRINKLQHESMGHSINDRSAVPYVSLYTTNGHQLTTNNGKKSYIELLNTCLK